MIQRSDRASFPLESLAELLGRDLHSHLAVQTGIAGAIHLTHAALANRRQDFVGPSFSPTRNAIPG